MTNEIKTIQELCAAFGAGKELEYTPVGGVLWGPVDTGNIGSLIYDFDRYTVRVKPEPAMVPLGPEDITLGRDVFRALGSSWHVLAAGMSQEYVELGREGCQSYDRLMNSYERSIDRGVTWHRCEKEAP